MCTRHTQSAKPRHSADRGRGFGLTQKETVSALTLQLGGHPLPKATGTETTWPRQPLMPTGRASRTGEPQRQSHVIRRSHLPEAPPFPSCLLHTPWDS